MGKDPEIDRMMKQLANSSVRQKTGIEGFMYACISAFLGSVVGGYFDPSYRGMFLGVIVGLVVGGFLIQFQKGWLDRKG